MQAFAGPEPRGPQEPLPPLARPMPSFNQGEPAMPSGSRMPQPPGPQPHAAPSMPVLPRMPQPPGPGAPAGMPPPGGIPPPQKKEGGFLGKLFKK